MKKLVEEVENEGFDKLFGEKITIFCLNYIYTGKLIGVNNDCVLLENPAIVYETGAFSDKDWSDCQPLNVPEFYIQKSCIESFGVLK